MDPIPGTRLNFPDPNNLMVFELFITPTDGLYVKAEFKFVVTIPQTYPYDPPKATCETPVSYKQYFSLVLAYLCILRSITRTLTGKGTFA